MGIEEQKLKALLDQILVREKKAYRRGLVILAISLVLGVGWLFYAAYRVQRQNKELDARQRELAATEKTLGDQQAQILAVTDSINRIAKGVNDPRAEAQRALKIINTYSEKAGVVTPTPTATLTPSPRIPSPSPSPKQTASPAIIVPTPGPRDAITGFVGTNYRGRPGTIITVHVTAVGNPLAVTYSLDGVARNLGSDGAFQFTLDKSKITRLLMVFDFLTEQGFYEVKMTANDGSTNLLRINSIGALTVVRSFVFEAL